MLRPEAMAALRGAEHIIHAGDVGKPEILQQLGEIAPVTAVRGNIDKGTWALKLPETQVVELSGITIYVLHDLGTLDLKPQAAGFEVVISGHSHVPKQELRDGVLYFNPGSAGPRRFKLPITVGRIFIENGAVRGEMAASRLDGGPNQRVGTDRGRAIGRRCRYPQRVDGSHSQGGGSRDRGDRRCRWVQGSG